MALRRSAPNFPLRARRSPVDRGFGMELAAGSKLQNRAPAGFHRGNCTSFELTEVRNLCSAKCSGSGQIRIYWNDPSFGDRRACRRSEHFRKDPRSTDAGGMARSTNSTAMRWQYR